MRYYGLNDYLPEHYPRNEWRKTKVNKKWLRKKPLENILDKKSLKNIFWSQNNISYLEKQYLDLMIDENVYVEKEINKHIRCAVPIYEEEVEIQNITDDD